MSIRMLMPIFGLLLLQGTLSAQNADWKVQDKTVTEWAKLLKSADLDERQEAASVLKLAGLHAKIALPELITCLKDEDARIRRDVATTIGRIGPLAKDAAMPLVGLVRDSDVAVKYSAVVAIGRIGAGAKSAASGLEAALTDEEALVRVRANESMMLIDPSRKRKCIQTLVAYIEKDIESEETRIEATITLSKHDPSAARVGMALLTKMWDADDHLMKIRICDAMCRIEPTKIPKMLPMLRKLAVDSEESERVRIEAIVVLYRISRKDVKEVSPLLSQWHQSGSDSVRLAAGDALRMIDPMAAKSAGVP